MDVFFAEPTSAFSTVGFWDLLSLPPVQVFWLSTVNGACRHLPSDQAEAFGTTPIGEVLSGPTIPRENLVEIVRGQWGEDPESFPAWFIEYGDEIYGPRSELWSSTQVLIRNLWINLVASFFSETIDRHFQADP